MKFLPSLVQAAGNILLSSVLHGYDSKIVEFLTKSPRNTFPFAELRQGLTIECETIVLKVSGYRVAIPDRPSSCTKEHRDLGKGLKMIWYTVFLLDSLCDPRRLTEGDITVIRGVMIKKPNPPANIGNV
jgi:hypothetical protein